jgi:hypothetical protein
MIRSVLAMVAFLVVCGCASDSATQSGQEWEAQRKQLERYVYTATYRFSDAAHDAAADLYDQSESAESIADGALGRAERPFAELSDAYENLYMHMARGDLSASPAESAYKSAEGTRALVRRQIIASVLEFRSSSKADR